MMAHRRLRSTRFLPEYVSRFKDRHGKDRLRFRRKASECLLHSALGTEEFRQSITASTIQKPPKQPDRRLQSTSGLRKCR
jgi:hypothetical protein